MSDAPAAPLRGAVPSPNIWQHTATYEVENRAADPDGRLWSAMATRVSWHGRTVLDLGCGSGFHLPRFAEDAATVIGVDPHPGLVRLAAAPDARAARRSTYASAPRSRSPSPTRASTWCTCGGPTSSGPAASPDWPSWTGSYGAAAPR